MTYLAGLNYKPNLGGNSNTFSPEYIVTAGLDHTSRVGEGPLIARVDTTLKSSYFTDFFNYCDDRQGFARNLENTRPLNYGSYTAAGADDVYNSQFGTLRTYDVRDSVKY